MNEELKEVITLAKKRGLSKDDLIQEAELMEEYGENYHMCFMGYDPDTLREAAEKVA